MSHDFKARAAQHRLAAGAVRHPPVGRVGGVVVLDEVQLRIFRAIERLGLPERIVLLELADLAGTSLHRLEHQRVLTDVFVNQIERK